MVDRQDLISDLEQLFRVFDEKKNSLMMIQKRAQNDARVTFYKHSLNTINSTIYFLIFTHKYLGNTMWWKTTDVDYGLKQRTIEPIADNNYPREFDYIDQHIGNSYFIFMFSSFEHSFRLVSEAFDASSFDANKNSFESLFKYNLKRIIPTENKNDFIEIVTTVRNSIHNNGAYVSKSRKNRPILKWGDRAYIFKHRKPIETDLWKFNIDFTRELLYIFDKIIENEKLTSLKYIRDPTE